MTEATRRRQCVRRALPGVLLVGLLASGCAELARTEAEPAAAGSPAEPASCCGSATAGAGDGVRATLGEEALGEELDLPDEMLVDQRGREVRFLSDVVRDRTVVISFFFTSCTTICPPIGATLGRVQEVVAAQGLEDVQLISISVDPVHDTPARLADWARRFSVGERWTLLSGAKPRVDRVLKSLHAFTARPQDHTPMVLVGSVAGRRWKQVYGLGPADEILRAVREIADRGTPAPAVGTPPASPGAPAVDAAVPREEARPEPARDAAESYFTNLTLVDQDGDARALYRDLMRGRTVVIHCFFSSCTGICPVLMRNLSAVEETFAERMGRDLAILSITVDPLEDSPARLREYKDAVGAGAGWEFLTGAPAQVAAALRKLGLYTEVRESHSGVLLIGNLRTGLWKKALGLASPEAVVRVVGSVLDDDGIASHR